MISPDADLENSDWTKTSWDLPPYMSREFLEMMGPDFDQAHFKTTPVYKHAVEQGLIHDDEWVDDSIEQGPPPPPAPAKTKDRVIHIHL